MDALARRLAGVDPGAGLPHPVLVGIARNAIETWRSDGTDAVALAEKKVAEFAGRRPRRIVNATGVLLHTNLGRAPLHPQAVSAAADMAAGYGNVELDLSTGGRGARHGHVEDLVTALTGAEAAVVVNNNAGALVLALAALAAEHGAVVSRGELIEIGGSFRLPDVMAASGARLIEVGTTNRTRTSDFAAVAGEASALLHVHPSNYRIEGFTASVSVADLAGVAGRHGIPLIADLGSGLLDDRTPWLSGGRPPWLAGEPGVRQTLEAGATVVLFSGDKLLGGPQAGIAVGEAAAIRRMARHPLMRALRLDGPTMAALGVTLWLYGSGRGGEIPFWSMATLPTDALAERSHALAGAIGAVVEEAASTPGGGTVPGGEITTPVVVVGSATDALWERLLVASPPVLARRVEGRLLIDLRTVAPDDDWHIAAVLG